MRLMNYVRAVDITAEIIIIVLIAEVYAMPLMGTKLSILMLLNTITLLNGVIAFRYAMTEIDFKTPIMLSATAIALFSLTVAYSVLNGINPTPDSVGATGVIVCVMTLIKIRGDVEL